MILLFVCLGVVANILVTVRILFEALLRVTIHRLLLVDSGRYLLNNFWFRQILLVRPSIHVNVESRGVVVHQCDNVFTAKFLIGSA